MSGPPPAGREEPQLLGDARPSCSSERLGSKELINKEQYIRLLEQALRALDFSGVAAALEKASGVEQEHGNVTAFRDCVLGGDWDGALSMLGQIGVDCEQALVEARFLIIREKFLEALSDRDVPGALRVLREELTPLGVHRESLHALAGCVLCTDDAQMQASGWPGSTALARQKLLSDLQAVIPAEILLPERRLEHLVEAALEAQVERNLFHNSGRAELSLMEDYECGTEQLPTKTVQVLQGHTDEVWHVAFSHNGKMLASTSKDTTTIIWEVNDAGRLKKKLTLEGHSKAVVCASWSPDDTRLATAGNDDAIHIWCAATGARLLSICGKHRVAGEEMREDICTVISCLAWMPDGRHLVSGTLHKRLFMWDMLGAEHRCWSGQRIQDLDVSPDGRWLLTITTSREIHLIDVQTDRRLEYRQDEGIRSLKLSADGTTMLLSMKDETLWLWALDLDAPEPLGPEPLHRCVGPTQQPARYVIKACLGGYRESFVLSGSESAQVLIWHRRTGERLAVLEGHTGAVNAVDWNPTNPLMFVSGSDDRSVHVWGPADAPADADVEMPAADAPSAPPGEGRPRVEDPATPLPGSDIRLQDLII